MMADWTATDCVGMSKVGLEILRWLLAELTGKDSK